jgi:cystathionine beta-lyase
MYDQTKCVHHPIVSQDGFASLSVATYRASTIVFDDAQSYADRHSRGADGYSYGLYGTPTSRTLEAQLTQLHGGVGSVLLSSGHRVLVPYSAYPPVLSYCRDYLQEFGIDHTVYDPLCGAQIEKLFDARTKLVWVESPGSTSLEVQDLPAIVQAAHRAGILVGCDNTWASPLLCKPLALGADFVVEALTKYVGGHADVLMGSVSMREDMHVERLRGWLRSMGLGVSPDDCSLVLRGLETMGVRLAHVGRVAADIAHKIGLSTAVRRVLHPSLPDHPGNASFLRDFSGASGLFSVELKPEAVPFLSSALDGLKCFAIGASWGGTHSLLAPITLVSGGNPALPPHERTYLRISIGLEDPDDIWDDLNMIFYRLERELQNLPHPVKTTVRI